MEIRWTNTALKNYEEVVDYSMENFGKFATLDLVKKVDAAIEMISKFPSAGPLVTSVHIEGNVFRRATIKGPLQLVYQEEPDVCTIFAVWNTKRAPQNLLKVIKN